MLIQCHSCNTKYRLNLERIPKRKTFVRCKNCGTPIFIDPTEESESAPGTVPREEVPRESPVVSVQPPPEPGMALIVCPDCQTRYRVPQKALDRKGIKLKCTQCGLVFQPPAEPLESELPSHVPTEPASIPPWDRAEWLPRPAAGAGGKEQDMPLPDERRMDTMFDDLKTPEPVVKASTDPIHGPDDLPPEEELGRIADSVFAQEESLDNPDDAYLDAVSFQDEDGSAVTKGSGSVPDEQKYKYFLDPKTFQESVGEEEDLPPLPEEFESELSAESASMSDDTPAASVAASEAAAETGVAGTTPREELMEDVPPLPPTHFMPSSAEFAQTRDAVPGQGKGLFSESRRQLAMVAAAVVILLLAGGWGYWLATTSGRKEPYVIRQGLTHQLVLDQGLSGRYVTNRPSGKRLFVVTGMLENHFSASDTVRWIRVKGSAYADVQQDRLLGSAYAYAGNQLNDEQLSSWDLEEIRAYYGYTNGRKDANYNIPSGAKVAYQLVFTDLSSPVERTVAQVMSYDLDGQSVFIESP